MGPRPRPVGKGAFLFILYPWSSICDTLPRYPWQKYVVSKQSRVGKSFKYLVKKLFKGCSLLNTEPCKLTHHASTPIMQKFMKSACRKNSCSLTLTVSALKGPCDKRLPFDTSVIHMWWEVCHRLQQKNHGNFSFCFNETNLWAREKSKIPLLVSTCTSGHGHFSKLKSFYAISIGHQALMWSPH